MTAKPNSEAFERDLIISDNGFREYDVRWLYPDQINLRGVMALGQALGTFMHESGITPPNIVVGHDYRSYSATIKHALMLGLVTAGCHVKDIGLALSPVAYFAQFELDCPAVAMVTASHNENGWTGVKMGTHRPLTFGPTEITRLKEIIHTQAFYTAAGTYDYHDSIKSRYIADLTKGGKISRPLKVVAACGNGTAGAYAPDVLRAIGCEVIEMDCALDYTFPHYNPNPEDLEMLHALSAKVKETGADLGFGFDGDGDRCGVVDNTGEEIFADKMGVILARDLSAVYPKASFVADVKSTGIYAMDPVLTANGATTDYWKTGHSYMKRRVHEIGALVGFEKSGHYFFNAPIGRGYDDGVMTAVAIARLMDRNPSHSLSQLKDALPKTWGSPTMAPFCPDECKYRIVEDVTRQFLAHKDNGTVFAGQKITHVVTVNGVRFTFEDGSWGLIRASSNKPSLVVVVESPVSEARMVEVFDIINATLATFPEIGAYDQTLKLSA